MLSLKNTYRCHEDLSKMEKTEAGLFCDSCEKEVIDLTKMSDQQIEGFVEGKSNFCAITHEHQLNRPLKGISAAAVGILASLNSFGQAVLPSSQEQEPDNHHLEWANEKATTVITGLVRDKATGETLPQQVVEICGANGEILSTVSTGWEGEFRAEFLSAERAFAITCKGDISYESTNSFVFVRDSVSDRTGHIEMEISQTESVVFLTSVVGYISPVYEDSTELNLSIYDSKDSVGIRDVEVQFNSSNSNYVERNKPATVTITATNYHPKTIVIPGDSLTEARHWESIALDRLPEAKALSDSVEFRGFYLMIRNQQMENLDNVDLVVESEGKKLYCTPTGEDYNYYGHGNISKSFTITASAPGYETLVEEVSINEYHPNFTVVYVYMKEVGDER